MCRPIAATGARSFRIDKDGRADDAFDVVPAQQVHRTDALTDAHPPPR
jgi:hypothetical protein